MISISIRKVHLYSKDIKQPVSNHQIWILCLLYNSALKTCGNSCSLNFMILLSKEDKIGRDCYWSHGPKYSGQIFSEVNQSNSHILMVRK